MRRIEVVQLLEFYKFTDKEKKQILDSMTILVDTREKNNTDILNYFDKAKVPYKIKKLDYGDYSMFIPANEELSIPRDLYFDKIVIIERKGSLEELSGNFTESNGSRIEKEMSLAPENKVLVIEDATYSKLINGEYNTNFNNKSYWARIHSFWFKYGVPFFFVDDRKYTGFFIRGYLRYFLQNYLR